MTTNDNNNDNLQILWFILKKGNRSSFQPCQWDKNDYELTVTRLQMPHTDGGFSLTPNTIVHSADPDGSLKETVEVKSGIIWTSTWIVRTPSCSFLWQWALQDTCMMNLFVSCSCMLTVNHRLWIMSCQRNRITFIPLELRVSLNWRLLLVWSWWTGIGYADFNPPGPLISVFHTVSSFHPFVSFHTTSSSIPRIFSSAFCVSGKYWVFILSFHWLLCSS